MQNLEKFHFHGQHHGEKIIKIIRRHWFNIAQQYFIVVGMVLLILVSLEIIPIYLIDQENATVFFFVQSFLAVILWLYSFIIWIDFYFDVWIITNQRIVNIEQKALFMRTVSELKFEKIQDVATDIKGLIPTVLNFGDVYAQTAANTERFLFHKVPDPQKIKGLIMNMQAMSAKRDEAEAIHRISPLLRKN